MKVKLKATAFVDTKSFGLQGAPHQADAGAVLEFSSDEGFENWKRAFPDTAYEVIEDKQASKAKTTKGKE